MLASCLSFKNTDIDGITSDGKPIWAVEIPKSTKCLYGVGYAHFTNQQNSESAAYTKASADIARQIRQSIQSATAVYTNEASESVVEATEQITIRTVDLTLQGIVAERKWVADDGTVWFLLSLPVKDIPKILELEANNYKNQLEERKLDIEASIVAALSATDIPDGITKEEWNNQVNSYANSQLKNLEDTSVAINPEEMGKKIKNQYLSKGYSL